MNGSIKPENKGKKEKERKERRKKEIYTYNFNYLNLNYDTPNFSSSEFIFICVSTNDSRKNVQLLIDVFKAGFGDTNHVKLYLRVNNVDVKTTNSLPVKYSVSKKVFCVQKTN